MRESESSDIGKLSHVPVFDGFRGLAILCVIVMHNLHIPFGWIGVDIFFVLSGFLITRILLNTRDQEGYLHNFYARRFLRIFPIYYLTLLFVAQLWLGLAHKESGNIWWYVCYLADFTWLKPEVEVGMLSHTWSLAIEEQFYIVWPLLIGWLPRRKMMVVCIALLVTTYGFRFGLSRVPELENAFTYSIFTRSDGILAGSILALLVHGGLRHNPENVRLAFRIMAVSMVIVFTLALARQLSFSKRTLLMSCLGMPSIALGSAAALWWGMGGTPANRRYRILTWPPLAYIGKISYGLYLYHLPIFKLGREWLDWSGTLTMRIALGVLMMIAAFAVASLSWHFFESPINGLKRYWEYNPKDEPAPERPLAPPAA